MTARNPFPYPLIPNHLYTSVKPECDARCRHRATHAVTVHQVDCCNNEGLTPDGAVVRLLCGECLMVLARSISRDITHMAPTGVRLACLTCGRPLGRLGDVLESEAI